MDLGAVINQFGLPLGLALYFLYRTEKTERERLQDMKDIVIKATDAMTKTADALDDYNKIREDDLAVQRERERNRSRRK